MEDAPAREKPTKSFFGLFSRKERETGKETKLDILRKIPIFHNLSNRALRRVSAIIYDRHYKEGEFMFEKDQPGAAMFIIKNGTIKITVPDRHGHDTELATLKAGTFVGELALLDDSPRSASAKAAEPTEALAFFRADLNKMIDNEPAIGSKILKELALMVGQRLKTMNDQLNAKENGRSSG